MQLTEENIADYADTLVLQVRGGGRVLDYSESSITIVEDLLKLSDPLFVLETFPEAQRNLVVFYNGCYLGETMARNLNGIWQFTDNWYNSTLTFAGKTSGLQAFPFQKLHRRVNENPLENDLTTYYADLQQKLIEIRS